MFFTHLRCVTHLYIQIITEQSVQECDATMYHYYSFVWFVKILFVHFQIIKLSHSVLKLFTGFATAALIAWKLTVSKVISKAPAPADAKIHHDNAVRYW